MLRVELLLCKEAHLLAPGAASTRGGNAVARARFVCEVRVSLPAAPAGHCDVSIMSNFVARLRHEYQLEVVANTTRSDSTNSSIHDDACFVPRAKFLGHSATDF